MRKREPRIFLILLLLLWGSGTGYTALMFTDVYLPSAGHGPGGCVAGVCSAWRTDAWVFNPSSQTALVDIFFLPRGSENLSATFKRISVAPQETRELPDIVSALFGIEGFGALRFASTAPVIVTGRIYDANVGTARATGTAGQFFAALPDEAAITAGARAAEIVGLAQDSQGIWRSNFGFVETAGKPVTVEVQRFDAMGRLLATKSYPLRAREPLQTSLLDVGGGLGSNQRLSVRVTEGEGRILAFGSRIDNRTGDPSTIQMSVRGLEARAIPPHLRPAVVPARASHLPAVGHAPGGCVGGICSQWRSDVWIFNPGSSAANVEIFFLERNVAAGTPARRLLTIAPAETRELADVVMTLFGKDNALGALRFVSDAPVAVTGRIFDANMVTNRGTGTAGQFFAAIPDEMAIDGTEAIEVIGLALDSDSTWRTNIGLVETSGRQTTVEVQRIDAAGIVLASRLFPMGPRENRQFSIADVGGPPGVNQRIRARLSSGTGRVIAFGSRIDNRTGDPSTIDMATTLLESETRVGAVSLKLTMPIPPDKRAALLQQVSILTGAGFVVAPDGSTVTFPDSFPGGWTVAFDRAFGFFRSDGTFTISLPAGTSTVGWILDPSERVVATINANQLVRIGSTPIPLVLQLPFTGPCKMSPSDPRLHGCGAPAGKTNPPTPPNTVCAIFDGFVDSTEPLIAYWGSTCQKRVLQGCCPNEGGWFIFRPTICCLKNHRGRECQDLSPGDLEVRLDPITAVDLDEPIPFVVHNNGCTGDTIMGRSDIGASMSGAGVVTLIGGYRVEHYDRNLVNAILCIEGEGHNGAWIGDRTVTYRLPKCLADQSSREDDDVQFYSTDDVGEGFYKTFRVKRDNLFRFQGGGIVFSLANSARDGWTIANADNGCDGLHLHGNHPCSGLPDPDRNGCGHGRVERAP